MDDEVMEYSASCSSEDIVCDEDENVDSEGDNSQNKPQGHEEDEEGVACDEVFYGGQKGALEDVDDQYQEEHSEVDIGSHNGSEVDIESHNGSEVDIESHNGSETHLEQLISKQKPLTSDNTTDEEEEAIDSNTTKKSIDDGGLTEDLGNVDEPFEEKQITINDENETDFNELVSKEKPFTVMDDVTEAGIEEKAIDMDGDCYNYDDIDNQLGVIENEIDTKEKLDDDPKDTNVIKLMPHEENVEIDKHRLNGFEDETTVRAESHLQCIRDNVDDYDSEVLSNKEVSSSPTIKSDVKMKNQFSVLQIQSEEAIEENCGEAPKVITHLESKIVPCGTRIRLFCAISGDPIPKVVWKRNRRKIPESSRYLYNSSEFGSSIDIYNVKSSDAGEYVCLASNLNGTTKTQAYLQVVGHREDSPSEPRFIECPEDAVTAKGDAITFEWRISGTPFPHVLWFKNNEKIETGLHVDVFCSHRGYCHLRITNVDENDCAVYSCYLENDVGSAVSTVQLSLLGDDKMISSQKGVSRGMPLNKENTPDNYLDFLLQSDTFNPHSVKSHRVILGSHLKADKAPDFVCAPYGLRVVNAGPTWVILSWFPPMHFRESGRALNYLLEKKQVSGSLWREVTQTHNTFFTAHELQRGKAYIFRVSAEKNGYWSLPSIMSVPVVCALK